MAPPYLTAGPQSPQALHTSLPVNGAGAVLLTHPTPPGALGTPLSIGAALDAALVGCTHNFVMVVGYFAHGDAGPGRRSDLGHPIAMILRELADRGDQTLATAATTRFRLLFAELRSYASQAALHRWWALCAWRARAPEAAAARRANVLAALLQAGARAAALQALREAHRRLEAAVLADYGWGDLAAPNR